MRNNARAQRQDCGCNADIRSNRRTAMLPASLVCFLALFCVATSTQAQGPLQINNATASSEMAEFGYVAPNAIDGNLATRWSTYGDGEYLQLDLGSSYSVTEARIAFGKGTQRSYSFELAVSTNGQNFTVIGGPRASSGTTTALETFALSATARYVRVIGHGNTAGTGTIDLSEVQLFGSAGGGGDTQPPTAPSSLSATPASSTQINLSWNASTDDVGVTGYQLERCQGSGCSNFEQVATPSGTSFNDTGLSASTTYRYRVRARDAADNPSAYSSIASATTQAGGGGGGQLSVLSATASSDQAEYGYVAPNTIDGNLTTRWSTYGDGEYLQLDLGSNQSLTEARIAFGKGNQRSYSFELAVSTNGQDFTVAGGLRASSGTTTALETFTLSATARYVRVIGHGNTAGTGTIDLAEVQLFGSGGGGSDVQAPTAPSTLSATPTSSSQINLTWSASTDDVGVTGYLLERCTGSSCSSFSQIATPADTSFNDTSLSASTTYRYRVRARDAANNLGAYSSIASATTAGPEIQPPTAPATLSATPTSSSQINLSWSASTDNVGVTGYLLERCPGAACSNFAQIATPSSTSFNDQNLTASATYRYRVRARDAANNLSGYSPIATATTSAGSDTQPPSTPVLSATPVSSSGVRLSWTASTDNIGVAGYLLERCQGSACNSFAEVVAPIAVDYTDITLSASTGYRYRVRARDAADNRGSYSNTVSVSTPAPVVPCE